MAVLKICTLPDPVLRKKARKVTDFGPDLQRLIDDMVETMRSAPGVGLAATQVDVLQRVIVVEYSEDDDEEAPARLFTMVNPEIVRYDQEVESGTEGCLSIPGYVGEVERPLGITIKGQNRHGQPMRIKAKGWLARIFQHEVDHLEGVLFIDRTDLVRELKAEDAQGVPLD
jgi:peptide deformylase